MGVSVSFPAGNQPAMKRVAKKRLYPRFALF
nr:MAG TPA_asm: hypothetical protein [Caudoviricetes sp.]